MSKIEVTATNPIELAQRFEYMSKLNNLPTNVLRILAELSQKNKAQDKLVNNENIIKTFIA